MEATGWVLHTGRPYQDPALCRLGRVIGGVNAAKPHGSKGPAMDCGTFPKNLMPFEAKRCEETNGARWGMGGRRNQEVGLFNNSMVREKDVYRPKRVFAVAQGWLKKWRKRGKGSGEGLQLIRITPTLPSSFSAPTKPPFYRATEAFFRDLFPDEPCPSFQAHYEHMRKKAGKAK